MVRTVAASCRFKAAPEPGDVVLDVRVDLALVLYILELFRFE